MTRYDPALVDGPEPSRARLRTWVRLAAEVQRRAPEYDVVVSWGERLTLSLMAHQGLTEAMAMGKPVIVSRTRGQVDVVQDGVTGVYVPAGDPVALRRAMLELWHDPERCAQMGGAARAYVEEHHALDKFCRDVRTAVHAAMDAPLPVEASDPS